MTRVYVRKFDWDEARARHANGESMYRIAESLGVTYNAVYRVVRPGEIQRQQAYQREWMQRGVCDDCGGPMNRMSRSNGSTRCRECASLAMATSVRDHELQCTTCREWKPDDAFPHNRSETKARRGRHQQCRVCQTVARREHRKRNREAARAYDREYRRRRRLANSGREA